jgi:RHS repeat-associated protein
MSIILQPNSTGKERDAESGNDDFGARYYASSMGRFMSPDPSGLAFADITNPQSLNLYSYAQNNLLKITLRRTILMMAGQMNRQVAHPSHPKSGCPILRLFSGEGWEGKSSNLS